LNVYVTQGCLNIDNNAAERALKRIAIGRKNWLFAGHDEAARSAAVLTTLIASVNGGVKVRRVAEEKCSARPINTPHTVGRQLLVHACCNTMDVCLSALAPN